MLSFSKGNLFQSVSSGVDAKSGSRVLRMFVKIAVACVPLKYYINYLYGTY